MILKQYETLFELLRLGLNNKTKYELTYFKNNAINKAVKEAIIYINSFKIRKERREMMISILKLFYEFLYVSETNQVCPSMKTIAFKINPKLQNQKEIHATIMRIQRAIKTLEEIDLIKIHKYYIGEEHFKSKKAPCFFYELKTLSSFSNKYRNLKDKTIKNTNDKLSYSSIYQEYINLLEEQKRITVKNSKKIGNFIDIMNYHKKKNGVV